MSFRDIEKKRLVDLKSQLFSGQSQSAGKYKNGNYAFCLHENCSDENIHSSIRKESMEYFKDRKISWHDGIKGYPSNHLCCSQSACINFLFPFRHRPALLKNVLNEMGYPVSEILPFYLDQYESEQKCYVAFEWIGTKNYLSERSGNHIAKDDERSRGKNFTSADFAILFKRNDNKTQLILGEWKYTEEYRSKGSIRYSKSGTDRLDLIYLNFLKNNSPIHISPSNDYSILFFDPFDQLMRLQLLAKQIELSINKEMNADFVTVLHIAPKANKELMEFIPHVELKTFGRTIHEVWENIVEPGKFKGFYVENLLPIITNKNNTPESDWASYMKTRYDIKSR